MDDSLSLTQGIGQLRAAMLPLIALNEDCSKLMDNLLRVICNLKMRYRYIDVEKIILENCENLDEVKRIGLGFNILEKYARHLLKPLANRSSMWRYVKFSNQFFKERVDAIKRGRDVMKMMGYTEAIEGGLSFPEGTDINPNVLIHLICDIVLLKYELDKLLSGLHPVSQIFVDLMPPSTQQELQVFQSVMDYKRRHPGPIPKDDKSFLVPLVNPSRVALGQYECSTMDLLGTMSSSSSGLPGGPAVQPIPTMVQMALDSVKSDAFSQQQRTTGEESNSGSQEEECNSVVCDICGKHSPELVCDKCDSKQLCMSCDDKWHQHPKRKNHERQKIIPSMATSASKGGDQSVGGPSTEPVSSHNAPVAMTTAMSQSQSGVPVTMTTPMMSQSGVAVAEEMIPNVGLVAPQIHGPSGVTDMPQRGVAVSEASSFPSERPIPAQADSTSQPAYQDPKLEAKAMVLLPTPTQLPQATNMGSPSLPQQSAAPGGPPTSKLLLRRIMDIYDPEKRESKIRIDLEMMESELQELDTQYTELIDKGADFEDEDIKSLGRRKFNLQKERREFEKYLRDTFPSVVAKRNEDIVNQPIFRPPSFEARYSAVSSMDHNMVSTVGSPFGSQNFQAVPLSSTRLPYGYDSSLGQPSSTFYVIGQNQQYIPVPVSSVGNYNASQLYRLVTGPNTMGLAPDLQHAPVTGHNTISSAASLQHIPVTMPHAMGSVPGLQYAPVTPPHTVGTDVQREYNPAAGQATHTPYSLPRKPTQASYGVQYGQMPAAAPQGQGQPPRQPGHMRVQGQGDSQVQGFSIAYPPGVNQNAMVTTEGLPAKPPIGKAKSSQQDSMGRSLASDPMEILATAENSINEVLLKESRESHAPFKLQKVNYQQASVEITEAASIPKSVGQERDSKQASSVAAQPTKHNATLNKPTHTESRSDHTKKSKDYSLPIQGAVSQGAVARSKSEGVLRRWVCEHCTYYNSPDVRVCEMCSKTSQNLTYVGDGPQDDNLYTPSPGTPGTPLEDEEETKVIAEATQYGQRAYDHYRQVEDEKKEAHEKFQETLRREKATAAKKETQTSEASVSSSEFVMVEAPEVQEIPTKSSVETTKPDRQPDVKKGPRLASVVQPEISPSPSPSLAYGSGGSPGNNFSKKMKELAQRKAQESLIQEGRNLLKVLKDAEQAGFEIEEIQLALDKQSKDLDLCLPWLENDWLMLVETLVTMVTNEGTRMEQNEIGEVSSSEAKKALLETNCDLDTAAAICIGNRRDMYKEISCRGTFAREAILMSMLHNKGDAEAAVDELNVTSIQPYCERVWAEFDRVALAPAAMAQPMDMQDEMSVTNSILNHNDFWVCITDTCVDMTRRIRMILVEGKLQSWGRAEVVIKILDGDVANKSLDASLAEIVEAVKNCQDYKSSLIYLNQECQICLSRFAMSRIRTLSSCVCKICVECMKGYFEVCIREKHVRSLSCPLCSQPDMENTDQATNYLTFLTMLLQTIVSTEDLELYDSKLRDWNLQKDPNFRWCAHCGNGFIWDRADVIGMDCPQCRKKTCYSCKKQWEDQHETLTCEQFEKWKIDNDPENQALGLARHLQVNGIDCPSCKMRYALAKGGCMHFKCPQCSHEFCSGCSQPFVTEGPCAGYKKCQGKGIHSHHPRDCFYYLRDNSVEELQKILRDKQLYYDVAAPATQDNPDQCAVMEQKEIGSQKKDEACGRKVEQGHAGLCVNHYKEFLVGTLNTNKADPVNILSLEEMKRLLEREEKNIPTLKEGERESHYRKRIACYIKEKVPLKRNR